MLSTFLYLFRRYCMWIILMKGLNFLRMFIVFVLWLARKRPHVLSSSESMQMEIMFHTHSECNHSLIFPRASCPSKVWNTPDNRNQPGGLFGAFPPLLSWNDRNTSDFIKNIQKYDVDIIKMIIRRKTKITQKKHINNELLSCFWKPDI